MTKSSNTVEGYMDIRLFEYEACFGTTLNMDKRQRLMTEDSAMDQ